MLIRLCAVGCEYDHVEMYLPSGFIQNNLFTELVYFLGSTDYRPIVEDINIVIGTPGSKTRARIYSSGV